MTEQLQTDYQDWYEGFQAEIRYIIQFNESSVVRTTYLGKVEMCREDALMEQEQFSLSDQYITMTTLLDGTNCYIILDSGATKGCMSKQTYHKNKLYGLSKFRS